MQNGACGDMVNLAARPIPGPMLSSPFGLAVSPAAFFENSPKVLSGGLVECAATAGSPNLVSGSDRKPDLRTYL